mgnify:CR=1 FL=1
MLLMSFVERLTDKKRVKWVFILTLISCFVTLFVSYSSWIIKGCRVFMPFISDMDLYQPEDTIFSVGGTLAGFFVLITLSDICWIKRSEIKRHSLSNIVNFLNYAALIPGALAAVSVMLLVNTPWNVDEPLHITLANNIFYGGAAWGILISIVSWRLNKVNPSKSNILYWRAFSAFFAGFSLVMMMHTFGNIDWSFYSEIDRMEYANSGKLCHSEYLAGAPVAAAYEWLLILGILGVIITFWNDLNYNSSLEEE